MITEKEKLEILEQEQLEKELFEIDLQNKKARQCRIVSSKIYQEVEFGVFN